MATKIRLKRVGGRHDPHYRIVVADSRKNRDGRAVEELGSYSPAGETPELEVNSERIEYWLGTGAQPTDTVRSLLVRVGILEASADYDQEAEAPDEGSPEEDVQEAKQETEASAEEDSEEPEGEDAADEASADDEDAAEADAEAADSEDA